MNPPTLRAELAAAVRRLNLAYNALLPSAQARVEIAIDIVEQEVDCAVLINDRPRALKAIAAWERHWRATFEEAAR